MNSNAISLGGSSSSFFPSPGYYANYAYTRDSSGTVPPVPRIEPPEILTECASRALQAHQATNHPYGTFHLPDGKTYDGTSRRGALFCRTGYWMEIVDKRTADVESWKHRARTGDHIRPQPVRGTRNETSEFGILEFLSIAFGLVSIRGVKSQHFLCMNELGNLYSAPASNYSVECVFLEEMMENYYNMYSSCAHGNNKRPWYVAIRASGRPRNGKTARKRRKSVHFLVVHHEEEDKVKEKQGDFDLQAFLAKSLYHQPPKDPRFRHLAMPADNTVAKPIRIRKITAQLALRKRQKKKRRREQRLQREEMRRRKRIEELEQLRKQEPIERERKLREFIEKTKKDEFAPERDRRPYPRQYPSSPTHYSPAYQRRWTTPSTTTSTTPSPFPTTTRRPPIYSLDHRFSMGYPRRQ